jgi:hypothetical protein
MGTDLVLRAIEDRRGEICNSRFVALSLAAAELVELALIGCVGLSGGHLNGPLRRCGTGESDERRGRGVRSSGERRWTHARTSARLFES